MATRHSNDATARTPPIEGMPGPRWNRSKGIYPTSLRRYMECPHRCRLEYIDRVRYEQPWTREIEVGNALHKVMERTANSLRSRQVPAPAQSFRRWVGDMLPAHRYDDQQERAADIDNVLEWAEQGEGYLSDGEADILLVEHYTPRRWTDSGELGSVLLGAKADVVVKRHDEHGPYVEIIDYKTGRNRHHTQFTPLLSRIALKRRIQAVLRQQRAPRVVFTYLWFRYDEVDERWMTANEMHQQWGELHRILVRMVNEETWPKRPNPKMCHYCPYFNTECFPNAQMPAFTALDAASERG